MRNVTISLDEEVARWARIEAARKDTSVSRMVGELLREMMESERDYQDAQRAFKAVRARRMRDTTDRYPTREELHDRAGLR